jgi:DNA-binding GntR family transcriptional regulator
MNVTPQPIGRTALAVEVTDQLRQMILEGGLEPGEKIQEKLLTEQFGVSRTPLREALKVLASEGLLDLIPNRGAVISRQTAEESREIFPVLAALEGLAGELAAQDATAAELAEIGRLTGALRQSYDARDRPRYFATNLEIHKRIIAAAKNATLARSHTLLAHRAQRARYQANLTEQRWAAAVAEHEEIAAILKARDSARAGTLMKAHILNKLDAVIASGAADE